nr:hypothetical protein [Tanacetum cinerariifolium]
MTLTFAETHNTIAYLSKSDASEGFNQIVDFLNGSSIKYALTVNPKIYVSCIQQFWTSIAVKKVNDIMRLQALVDKKKVVIMEATLRDAFRLDDAEGIECLPNEEIFDELARIGYEKPSTKLTFTRRFSQKQVGDLSSHTTKYSSPALIQKVFANMRRVGKGFFGVKTPLFKGMIVEQQIDEGTDEGADEVHDEGVLAAGVVAKGVVSAADDEVPTAIEEPSISSLTPPNPPPQPSQNQPSTSQVQLTPPQAQPQSPQHQPQPLQNARISMDLLQNLMDTCTILIRRVEHLEHKVAQALEITKLKKRIETSDDIVMDDVSKQRRMIADTEADVDVILEDAKEVAVEKFADVDEKPAELQKVVEVVTTAKLITEVVTATSTTLTAATPQLTTAAAPTLTTSPSVARRGKGVVIRDPQESATPSKIIHSEAKSKDKGKEILVEEPKPLKKKA